MENEKLEKKKELLMQHVTSIDSKVMALQQEMNHLQNKLVDLSEARAETVGGIRTIEELLIE